jgi:hypothetical protein
MGLFCTGDAAEFEIKPEKARQLKGFRGLTNLHPVRKVSVTGSFSIQANPYPSRVSRLWSPHAGKVLIIVQGMAKTKKSAKEGTMNSTQDTLLAVVRKAAIRVARTHRSRHNQATLTSEAAQRLLRELSFARRFDFDHLSAAQR